MVFKDLYEFYYLFWSYDILYENRYTGHILLPSLSYKRKAFVGEHQIITNMPIQPTYTDAKSNQLTDDCTQCITINMAVP